MRVRVNDPSAVRSADLEDLLAAAITEQHPEADDAVLRAATNLKRAFNVLNQAEYSLLRESSGLTPAAFRVLFMIWCFDSISATEITRLSGVSRQGVSAGILNLERAGFITRTRSGSDRRLAPIRITEEGARLVEAHLLPQNELHQTFFRVLSPDELRTFNQLAARLVAGFRDSI